MKFNFYGVFSYSCVCIKRFINRDKSLIGLGN